MTIDLSIELRSLQPASEDASFRRYFRASTAHDSFVVMDAPPESEEIEPFIAISGAIGNVGAHTPKIFAQDIPRGFLLLEDLGIRTYLDELPENAPKLYSEAISALLSIQTGHLQEPGFDLPEYDETRLKDEMSLFDIWFINKHLGIEISTESQQALQATKALLVRECLAQPQVWVHRDYHSRNLMVTDDNSPGVIDFQDMVLGPIAYDLASIFKDCYIEWPRQQQLQWLREYHSLVHSKLSISPFSFDQLVRWYDMAGLQRHLKVLGIFCRLYYRDNKSNYLKDLPLVAKYTLEAIELYPELSGFKRHFANSIESVL